MTDVVMTSAHIRVTAAKDRTPTMLAYTMTAGLFGLLVFLVFRGVPQDSVQRNMLSLAMGVLLTNWTAIVSYYFGCVSGDAAKDLLLHQSVPQMPPAARRNAAPLRGRVTVAARVPGADAPAMSPTGEGKAVAAPTPAALAEPDVMRAAATQAMTPAMAA